MWGAAWVVGQKCIADRSKHGVRRVVGGGTTADGDWEMAWL